MSSKQAPSYCHFFWYLIFYIQSMKRFYHVTPDEEKGINFVGTLRFYVVFP